MSQSTLPGQTPPDTDAPAEDRTDADGPQLDSERSSAALSAHDASDLPRINDNWDDSEFHYKQIPVLAPVSLVLGLVSLIVFVTSFGIIIGTVGAILGLICFLSTMRNRSEIGGFGMTVTGLILCTACVLYGSSKLAYDYATEVPEGFERISFANDIAEKPFKYEKGTGGWTLHPDVVELHGRKVFLKGYMYPTRVQHGLTEFILAKDSGECCMGGEPKVTDMILVKMKAPLTADYLKGQVSVAGEFRTQRNTAEGMSQVYELEATHFTASKTAF